MFNIKANSQFHVTLSTNYGARNEQKRNIKHETNTEQEKMLIYIFTYRSCVRTFK